MPEIDAILKDVHAIRMLLIHVGTGERRIQDAESEYVKLRSQVSQNLRALGINDPNAFHSLWDWYGYWRSNGLGSYQSRREYVNNLYKDVISALESVNVQEEGKPNSEGQPFSVRHGYANDSRNPEISIREDAPADLRRTIVDIATRNGWSQDGLLDVASRIGKKSWESSVPKQAGTPSRIQLEQVVLDWPWFLVYDFIERVFEQMRQWEIYGEGQPDRDFEEMLNEYFRYSGVGWQLREGKIVSRGSEAFGAGN